MNEFEVRAVTREGLGKGETRRLRRTGMIPAVIYGSNEDPAHLSLYENELKRQMSNEAFFSHILGVSVEGGKTSQAVIKSLQRDPATDRVIHVDFQRVSSSQELQMSVPLHFMNEDTCPGAKAGGIVSHLMVDVEIACLPKDLPEYIEVDLAAVELGQTVHLSELQLPEGVRLGVVVDESHDPAVVSVAQAFDLDAEPAEGEEGEEGAGEDEEA